MSEEPHVFRTLRLSIDGGVAVAEIDNPPVNLITPDLYRDLRALPDLIEADDGARVLVLRSANPDFFIAHYDVEQILAAPTEGPAVRGVELRGFHKVVERYRTMAVPTICEIAGRVGGGGGELAASCDMRFGTPATTLCQMEVPLGILPGGSGTQRLPRLLGRGRAMEIVLGGDDIDGVTLERWGWLNRALPPGELRPFVDRLAARIAGFPPQAVARAKASVLAAGPDPTEGLLTEAFLFQETLRHPSSQARMRAFLERGGHTPEGELRVGALGAELGPDGRPDPVAGGGAQG
jgi:enoyl-CoA hydratase/carnithine racemase